MTKLMDFPSRKRAGHILTLLTCYDACFAAILQDSDIDAVLVGDSAAMVMHGHTSTLTATVEMIAAHVRAVRAGAPTLPIIADMPFLSTRGSLETAVTAAGALMAAGADGVKIEGLIGHEQLIPHLIHSGIPVMGHLGLTPQMVHVLGGYKVQGKTDDAAAIILEQARELEALGCFGIVAECVPTALGTRMASQLEIPVIGIGAGDHTDGQILVLQDMLGLGSGRVPKFVRKFMDGKQLVAAAVNDYIASSRAGSFPGPDEQYGGYTGSSTAEAEAEAGVPYSSSPGARNG
ncbi:MAG: 3-methyl-2-oxobutanoate hydroxymethyltransferase [Spirochaetaceae bacterium]|nr:MAG: 3-methyl-2-oxobutanoate hydroxymethyltransferase [Spirochaetaceae bacterium]